MQEGTYMANKVIIVGCGPSGMMAAISCARLGADVTVLEGQKTPGKKLLLTGNGRCNLTNLNFQPIKDYTSSDAGFLRPLLKEVFSRFSVEDTLSFFHEIGLMTVTDHGTYVYPLTGQSKTVLDLLLSEMRRLKVKLKLNEKAERIVRNEGGGWKVYTQTWAYDCSRVILSCGSCAVPSTGSDGSGYQIASGAGLEIEKPLPALCACRCELPVSAFGTRMQVRLTAIVDQTEVCSEEGQLQWTENGLSGIVVFNLSRYVSRAVGHGKKAGFLIDLLPQMGEAELAFELERIRSRIESGDESGVLQNLPEKVLMGILPSRVISLVLAEYNKNKKDSFDAALLAAQIKAFRTAVTAVRDFEYCQVAAGGVKISQVRPESLECRDKNLQGIYLTGELLDVDGPCGGYNLQWAWSSGYVAGVHAAIETESQETE